MVTLPGARPFASDAADFGFFTTGSGVDASWAGGLEDSPGVGG